MVEASSVGWGFNEVGLGRQCRYNVQYVFGLQDYAEDYAVLDSCKHLDQTCRDWGRKKNTVSSECYLSGYHPTQSYLKVVHKNRFDEVREQGV